MTPFVEAVDLSALRLAMQEHRAMRMNADTHEKVMAALTELAQARSLLREASASVTYIRTRRQLEDLRDRIDAFLPARVPQ